MKKIFLASAIAITTLSACNNEKEILKELSEYNYDKETSGYHFGDVIELPKNIKENTQNITISLGDEKINDLKITEKHFKLGENIVTFILTTKDGKELTQDATIQVFAKNPEKELNYEIVNTYPHNPENFAQGFQLEGNTIYESVGQNGSSKIMKYTLGNTTAIAETPHPVEVFSEGATIVNDKVYQLTWKNKKGYIYNKNTLKLIQEFEYPNVIIEGWGLTYDGKNLIASDGTKNLYYIDPENPSKLIKYITVAGNKQSYDQLNELEYHNGYIYANVWRNPTILKINPKTGEVVATIDLAKIAVQHTIDTDDVLNGIAFKGENMLVTGKRWNKIYEIKIKE